MCKSFPKFVKLCREIRGVFEKFKLKKERMFLIRTKIAFPYTYGNLR